MFTDASAARFVVVIARFFFFSRRPDLARNEGESLARADKSFFGLRACILLMRAEGDKTHIYSRARASPLVYIYFSRYTMRARGVCISAREC